ncbi:exonuclease domain-containing protein [Tardiphaga sp.]|uniref:exonuclease domain-containing protein n=1 Tax=Tardiphaga sp. TaxID=1926292 RepID=UPI0026377CC8|nr:exonuclease domain-containing protein [Tardiphaga sp.]MDB5616063.1 polymerase-3 subunit epsilon [Tardiphaga sp.]
MAGGTDFIALDVETANADVGSICSVGLAHFRRGEVFKSLTILVDPEGHFEPRNVSIHGIRPADVVGKPTMAKVFPVISQYLNDTIVTHHSPFDRRALARAAVRYGSADLDCFWIDTVSVARRTWPAFAKDGGFGLANLARSFDITFRHHEAAEDARASGLIMLRALEDSGLDLEDWLRLLDKSPEPALPKTPPPRKNEAFARYARSGRAAGRLAGETVLFTGFLQINRAEAVNLASAAGCDVADTATRKVTILVVGDQDLRLTRGQEKSTKHRKIEGLIANGARIRIVGEADFLLMVS